VTHRAQGVDRWHLKIQRAADKNFDKFELYTLKNILRVPSDVQQVPSASVRRPRLRTSSSVVSFARSGGDPANHRRR
jgi:hypothetical protein